MERWSPKTKSVSETKLAEAIASVALLTGEFTLRSGRTSHYYIDKYLFSTQPHILAGLAQKFAAHVDSEVTCLGGAELGGIPLVTALSLQVGLPTVFIRNSKKDYGTSKQLEGALGPEDRVLLVEDVCTSGGQILEAASIVEAQGARVVKIVSTIDREEGAREAIEGAGYRYACLFKKSDLGV